MKRVHSFGLLSASLMVFALLAAPANATNDALKRQADVVQAVGLVRHFHPHDAVEAVDFNGVLLQAFALAHSKNSDSDFATALVALLAELGTGMTHQEPGQDANPRPSPGCSADDPATRWVHRGFAAAPIAEPSAIYSSRRSVSGVREMEPQAGDRYSMARRSLSAEPWRGRSLRFAGDARVRGEGQAALWVGVEGGGLERDRVIESSEWSEYEIEFKVGDSAEIIDIRMLALNEAHAEFRSLELVDTDNGENLLPRSAEWHFSSVQSSHELDLEPLDDDQLVRLTPRPPKLAPADIDRFMPADAPDVASLTLVDGSSLNVPLVLCQSQASAGDQALAELASRFAAPDLAELSPVELARLDVAVLWPVLRHLYPYQELVGDWNGMLMQALAQAGEVDSRQAHRRLLQRLMAGLEDGHASVREQNPAHRVDTAWLPIALEPVAGEPVVARRTKGSLLRPGDRIIAIDGQRALEWMAFEREHQSGSKHWRTYKALLQIMNGPRGQSRELTVMRDGDELTVELPFELDSMLRAPDHEPVETLADGVIYIDLAAVDQALVDENMPDLLRAPGVIFDLRGYPSSDMSQLLGRLMNRKDDWDDWTRTLVARGPEGDLIDAESNGWNLQRVEPAIEGPIVFLTDHRAISYSETILGLVKRYGLADIVGSETAGSNGNPQFLTLPGQFHVGYTAMRVIGPDGEILQGRGITPDRRVHPTVEGLSAGRDEVLESALEELAM